MGQPGSLLDRLVGERLSSVTFVRDYLQFDFDGPRLSVFVWPCVEAFEQEWRFGDQGYRDALCGRIGRTVTGVSDASASGVVLRFDEDAVVINPEAADLRGPEIAMLQMNDEERAWDIWRSGESSFADRTWDV